MIVYYLPFTVFVNSICGKFLQPRFLLLFVYNLRFLNINSLTLMYNHNYVNLNNYLFTTNLKPCVKYFYLNLLMRHKVYEKFYINFDIVSSIFQIKPRTLRSHFSDLAKISLITKHHNSESKELSKKGNKLYIELTPPLSLVYDNSPLTFQVRFQMMGTARDHDGESRYAWVGDVYNDEYELYGSLQHIHALTEEEVQLFESLEEGDYVFIEAQIESFDEKDPYKIKMLKRPTKIWKEHQ